MSSKKGKDSSGKLSQDLLFTEAEFRGEEQKHILYPEDYCSYDDYTVGEHNKRLVNWLENNLCEKEVSCFEFYRTMFCIDEDNHTREDIRVQDKNESPFENQDEEDSRVYRTNPIVYVRTNSEDPRTGSFRILFRDCFDEELSNILQNYGSAYISGLTYFGKKPSLKHAGMLYAFIFDLDGVTTETLPPLKNLMTKLQGIPMPQFITVSGMGLHLIYLIKPTVITLSETKDWLRYIKRVLTTIIWTKYTSVIDVQSQGISQSYRITGSPTKIRGIKTRTFKTPQNERYSVEELESYITEADEENYLRENKWQKPPRPEEKQRIPLNQAKEKWPEWWEKVEESKKTGVQRVAGSWVCNRAVYDWWLQKIKAPGNLRTGHRYYSVMIAACMARKCAIPFEELRHDMEEIMPFFNALGAPRFPFTTEDLEAGLRGYNHQFAYKFSLHTISALTGIHVEKKTHPFLESYRNQQKRMAERKGIPYVEEKMTREKWLDEFARQRAWETQKKFEINWRENGGKKNIALEKLKAWVETHPDATISDATNDPELGLSRTTIYKHWEACGGRDNITSEMKLRAWLEIHPNATISDATNDPELGLSRTTVSRYWKTCGGKESLTSEMKLRTWREAHPEAQILDAVNDLELGLGKTTVYKYWSNCGAFSTSEERNGFNGTRLEANIEEDMVNESKRDLVIKWRKEHPQGRRVDLYKSNLGISKSTVDRWWNFAEIEDRPVTATEKIRAWRRLNPDGTKASCQVDTGLSRRSVYLRWNDAEPIEVANKNDKPQEKIDEDGQYLLF